MRKTLGTKLSRRHQYCRQNIAWFPAILTFFLLAGTFWILKVEKESNMGGVVRQVCSTLGLDKPVLHTCPCKILLILFGFSFLQDQGEFQYSVRSPTHIIVWSALWCMAASIPGWLIKGSILILYSIQLSALLHSPHIMKHTSFSSRLCYTIMFLDK